MPTRQDLANAIRMLSADAVEQAKSGHPGMPMGMADMAEVLWNDFLSHNPANPAWPNRDRFVVSNGHGSMLLYSLLHLSGYKLPMEELKRFRQLHSKTPGHPEVGMTPGVETTTGPLGQGIANAIGMALAEKLLAQTFNQPGHSIIDHHTYVFLGDGCMMEGISHEACSLAGTLGLGKLIALYDDNGISIDGKVEGWFTDNTPLRFASYGWHVVADVDGHNPDAIKKAILEARVVTDKPSLICCKTLIGKGAPNKQGSAKTHGSALGGDEIAATRAALNWPYPPFVVPEEVKAGWDASAKGQARENDWNERFAAYQAAHPELAAELKRRIAGDLPADWPNRAQVMLDHAVSKKDNMATRKASQLAVEALGKALPEFLGGSADLADSVFTAHSQSKAVTANSPGNFVNYGVREFAMYAINNGMALHGGFIPYAGTFLVFSDYCRNAIRMASLMKLRNIFVLTHDSIGVGEDGPTHQPVEHVSSLRLIPGLHVWRPGDVVESAYAWKSAIEHKTTPSALIFSRQNATVTERDSAMQANIVKGAYVLRDAKAPKAIIIATGTELDLALKAHDALAKEGIATRVVSMPCTQLFDQQTAAYKASVLPAGVRRIAIEAGITDFWYKYVGLDGKVIGIDSFGESAPAPAVYQHFGITVEALVEAVKA